MLRLLTSAFVALFIAGAAYSQIIITDEAIDPALRFTTVKPLVTPQGQVNPQSRALFNQNLAVTCAIPAETQVRGTQSIVNNPHWKKNPRFEVHSVIDVPKNTIAVIPAIEGWRLNYGNFDEARQIWKNPTDENYGLASANVFVESLTQTNAFTKANIRVVMTLMDDNFDNVWSGKVNYTLLCLGFISSPIEYFSPDAFRLPLIAAPLNDHCV